MPKVGRVLSGFSQLWLEFKPGSGLVGFVVDKVALRKVFSDYLYFIRQFSFYQLHHTHHHHHPSSEAGIIRQTVACVPSGLSLKQPQTKKIRFECLNHCLSLLEAVNTYIRDNKNIAFHLVSMIGLQNFYILFRHVVTNLINAYYMNKRCALSQPTSVAARS
jgi:hypothetical protein